LHVGDGRDTKALNCKPNTNLKEKNELSNYCKTSGYCLHAVIGWWSRLGSPNMHNSFFFRLRAVAFLAMFRIPNKCPTISQKK
jgi:hypothetical protein